MGKRIVLVIGALVLAGDSVCRRMDGIASGIWRWRMLAYQKLTPQAKTRVNDLLKLNPKYSEWKGWYRRNVAGGHGHDGVHAGGTVGGRNQR